MAHTTRSLPPLPTPRWIWLGLGILVLGGHAALLHFASSSLASFIVPAAAVAIIAVLMLVAHLGFFAALPRRLRGRSRT